MDSPKESMVERVLRGMADRIFRHPWWFFTVPLILLVMAVFYTVRHLEMSTSRNDLVDADKTYHRKFLEFRAEFPALDDIVVVVESGNMEKNRQFVERLATRLEAEPGVFTNVFYKGDLKMMGPKALQFVPEEDLREMRSVLEDNLPFIQKFTQATNLNSLFQLVNREFARAERNTNNTANIDALIQGLPALERLVDQVLDSLNRPGIPPSPGVTALFAAGQEAERSQYITFDEGRMYLVTTHARNRDVEFQAVFRLRELVQEVKKQVPGVNVGVTGEPVLEYDEMEQARKDTLFAAIVALAIVALIFIYSYDETGRPLKATFCLLVGVGYTLGFASLAVGHLNILTITFVPILIGLAIDFGVHLITRYEEELRGGAGSRVALRKAMGYTGTGIFTSGLTTAGAFFAMALTDFKGVREMGIISGGGLLLSLIPMMIMLPVLLLKGNQNFLDQAVVSRGSRKRETIERIWLERPKSVVVIGMVLTALAVLQFPKVYFDYNLLHLQTEDLPAVEYEHRLIERTGKSVLFGAVIADSLEEAVELKEQLEALGTVAEVQSIASFLTEEPEVKLGMIRDIKGVLEPIHFPPVDLDRVDLDELGQTAWSMGGYLGAAASAAERKGADLGLVNQLLSLRAALQDLKRTMLEGNRTENREKLTAFQVALFQDLRNTFLAIRNQDASEGLRITDLPATLRNRFVGVTGKYLLQVYPEEDVWDRQHQEAFVADLRSVVPGATGTPVQLLEYTTLLKESFVQAAWYALVAIGVLVFAHFRRISCVLLALLPVTVGACWMGGLMGWLGIPFNPANIMTLPLVIGIGVTSGIHILNRFAEENKPSILAKSTGKAVLVSALTTMAGFGSLMLAKHQGIQSLGHVMSIGVATCMVAALTLFTSVLTLLTRAGWTLTKKPSNDR